GLTYEPGYHMGFNLGLLLVLLVYRGPIKEFVGVLIVSAIILFLTIRVSDIRPTGKYLADWQSHVLVDFIVFAVVAWIIYQGMFKQLQEREILYGKYLEVGRKTSMIVHD